MTNRISWSWRHAFAKAEMASTTKLVLHTIGLFMDETGNGAYPTTRQISELSGLSHRAVITHIQIAIELGWLRSKKHGFKGQNWRNHEYEAHWPDESESAKGTEPDDKKVVKEVPEGGERHSNFNKKVVKEVHTNVPIQHSNKRIIPLNPPQGNDEVKNHFDEFWEAYDYKKGKQAALKVWKRKKLDHKAQEVISGARQYAQTRGSDPRYWKHPQGWLNDGRWEDYQSPPSQPQRDTVPLVLKLEYFRKSGNWFYEWGPEPDLAAVEMETRLEYFRKYANWFPEWGSEPAFQGDASHGS